MKALLAGFASLLVVSTASAAESDNVGGWYIGIGGGQTSMHHACSFAESLSPTLDCDDESVGAKVMLGQSIYKYTSLELSYIDAGEARITSQSVPASTLEINPRLLNLFLTFDLPLGAGGRLGLIGKFGMTYFDTKYSLNGSFPGMQDSDDGITGALGAGISWRGWQHFSIRAEWEHFNDVSVDDGDVDMGSVSILFHF